MKLCTLDFESFYSKDFSLSKMPTMSYIRDPRFQTIGFSMKVNDGPTTWYTGSDAQIASAIPPQSWWDDTILVAHNTGFDGSILSQRYNVRPKFQCCTMGMARSLGMDFASGASLKGLADTFRLLVDPTMPHKGNEVVQALGKRREDFSQADLDAYGHYCITDTEITSRIFTIMAAVLPNTELRWQDTVLRMFTDPAFILDTLMLEGEAVRVRARKDALMQKLIAALGVGTEAKLQEYLGSNQKFASVLEAIGITPPTKISKVTGKRAFAFAKSDEGMKELLEHDDMAIQLLASVRVSTKSTIEESRVAKFIGLSTEGAWGIPYNVSGAHTGRLSGADGQNPQNLPSGRIPGQTKAMRQSIKAPDGCVVVAGDSSQVEARVLAFIAGQSDLLAQFAAGVDVYSAMAARIYNGDASQIAKGNKSGDPVAASQRQIGKSAQLGAGFGIGAPKFKDYVRVTTGKVITIEEAKMVVATYRQSNAMIVGLWKQCDGVLRSMISGGSGYFGGPTGALFVYDGARMLFGVNVPGIRGPNGMWLNYPELRFEPENKTDPETGEIKTRQVIVYTKAKGRGKMRAYTYGAALSENLTQFLAFVLIKHQALLCGKRYPMRLNTHDEIAITAPAEESESARAWVEQCMKATPSWLDGCPITCEVGVAARYGDC